MELLGSCDAKYPFVKEIYCIVFMFGIMDFRNSGAVWKNCSPARKNAFKNVMSCNVKILRLIKCFIELGSYLSTGIY
jgi:hypothetical protein